MLEFSRVSRVRVGVLDKYMDWIIMNFLMNPHIGGSPEMAMIEMMRLMFEFLLGRFREVLLVKDRLEIREMVINE